MPASPERPEILPPTAENIRRAADAVRAGELVVIPTETVYGVAARADSPAAMARLFAAKGRDESKRIALFADGLEAVRRAGARVDGVAERLAAAFWPGPLTMVLRNAAGGGDGFRVPDHPVALAWLRELREVVPAVTSANRSGEPPAKTAQEACSALAGHVVLALDAGPVAEGVPSTVVKVGPEGVEILRAGALSIAVLAQAAGCPVKG